MLLVLSLHLGCHSKIPQTKWLKQQKFFFPQLWRLPVQDQGVGRFSFSSGLSPWLADGHVLTVALHGLSFVFARTHADLSCHFLFLKRYKSYGPTHDLT